MRFIQISIFLFSVAILTTSCDKTPTRKWGVVKILPLEKEVGMSNEDYAEVYRDLIPGVNEEIVEKLNEDLSSFNEGKFGGDNKKLLQEIFPGYFFSLQEMDDYYRILERASKNSNYTLYDSYTKYISRCVETDEYLVFAVENYVKFDLQIIKENPDMNMSIKSDLELQYGTKYVDFDFDSQTFSVDGSHMVYALCPKDTLDFYFLSEVMMHDSRSRLYIPNENFVALRRYFSEASIYQK